MKERSPLPLGLTPMAEAAAMHQLQLDSRHTALNKMAKWPTSNDCIATQSSAKVGIPKPYFGPARIVPNSER